MPSNFDYSSGRMRAAGASTLLMLCTACGGGSKSEPPPVAPAISTQPASLTVAAGTPATFTVAASGSAALSYQWKRNGADIAGATAASYTLPATQLSDTRSKWSVAVRNAVGTVASSEANLHVTGIGVWAGNVEQEGFVDGAAASARFARPFGLAFDKDGNLLVADEGNKALRKITPVGQVSTFGPGFEFGPWGITLDSAGNIYTLNFMSVFKLTPAGVSSVLATVPYCGGRGASICSPNGIAVDAANNVYVASGAALRKIAPNGSFALLEGTDGREYPSTGWALYRALAFDGKSSLLHVGGLVRKIDSAGVLTTVATSAAVDVAAAAFDAAGNLYYTATWNNTVRKMTPAGVVSTVAGVAEQEGVLLGALPGRLQWPKGIAIDAIGDLYVTSGNAVLKIQLPPQ